MVANAGLHHQIYFDLIGTSANIKNFYDVTKITKESISQKEIDELVSSCTELLINDEYVYVMNEDPLLKEQFGVLFENGTVTPETLYRIEVSGDSVLLIPCNKVR